MIEKPQKSEIDLRELMGGVFTLFQENIPVLSGGVILMSVVPMLCFIPVAIALAGMQLKNLDPSSFTFETIAPLMSTSFLGTIGYFLVFNLLRTGWTAICLNISAGKAASFSELFSNFRYFLNFFLVSVLMVLAVGAASLLLVLPGIYLALRFSFAHFLVVDRNMGPVEALGESWKMTDGVVLNIFLSYFALLVLNLIGGMIPLLGMLVALAATAFVDLLIAAIYRSVKGDLVLPD